MRSDGVFEFNKTFGKKQSDYSLSKARLSDSKKVIAKILSRPAGAWGKKRVC